MGREEYKERERRKLQQKTTTNLNSGRQSLGSAHARPEEALVL